jgi:gluconate 2-dehydrogenase alpha chain
VIGATMTGTQPISTFGDLPRSLQAPRWGSAWKKASMEWYDRTANIGFGGEHIPYVGNYFDLDPTYKNPAGDPLLRMTIN